MQLSFVSTMYKSEDFLDEFVRQCVDAAESVVQDFEIILVNDGSPDGSLAKAQQLRQKDDRIRIVDLSRNFGHHSAIRAGLKTAKGDWVFLIDSDLEESPLWLSLFWTMRDEETDVVYGTQESRKGNWWERLSGWFFYSCIKLLSGFPIPRDVVTARLMSREYVSCINEYMEKDTELWLLFAHAGFNQKGIKVNKKSKGTTTYSTTRKVRLFISAITSSSNAPLYLLPAIGCLMWFFSLFFLLGALAKSSLRGAYFSVFGLGISTVCIFIGITAVYLAKIFIEVKRRPYAIERRKKLNG